MAKVLEPASEALAEACGVGAGTQLLDVGSGTGNMAIESTRRGATVVASDLTPELIAIGKERSLREGLSIRWETADAEDLPFESDSFDVVTSVFGAIFAPRASEVAREMLRVTKPGGLVGFTSWANDGYGGALRELFSKYAPPPPEGVDTPESWGDEDVARARFEAQGAVVEVRSGTLVWNFESKKAARDFWESCAPPTVAAKNNMPPAIFEEMMKDYESVRDRFDRGSGGRVTVDSRFLIVLARKPA